MTGPKPLALMVGLGLAGTAAGAAAQDLRFSQDATMACMAVAADSAAKKACIGKSAELCMTATIDGGTTVGMGGCLDREFQLWDAMLNAAYTEARSKAKASDEEMKQIGATVPLMEPALRDMQRAWIPYRDATCDFERSQWGGGTGGGPATIGCLMRLTGEQAIYLADIWTGY